jgi:hypothetical protein
MYLGNNSNGGVKAAYGTGEREGLSDFFRDIFTWMLFGLAITGVIAELVSSDKPMVIFLSTHVLLFYILIGLQLAAVLGLSFGINKLPAVMSETIFVLYAALTGVTFSTIFLIYTSQSIGLVFFLTAFSFGLLAFIGYTTKKDLTSMGNFMFVGLIAIIVAMFVNFFLHSSALMYIISVLGVIIFLGLTAYDMQKLKQIYLSGSFDERKETVMGALTLYLDFINLFLMLLNLFGQQRD